MKKTNFTKTVTLVLILVLVLGVTGCSQAELGYINLYKEITNQNLFESNGSISFQINYLPKSMTDNMNEIQLAVLKKVFADFTLTTSTKADYSNNLVESKINIKEKSSGIEKEILSVIFKDDIYYIRVKEILDLVKLFNDMELNKQINGIFGNAEYISISVGELSELSNSNPPSSSTIMEQQGFDLSKQKQFNLLWVDLIGNLATKTYNNYNSGLVNRSGNQYILTLEATNLSKFLKTLAVYTVNNCEKLGPCLKTYISSLSKDQLGMTEDMKQKALLGIDEMVKEVVSNRAEYLTKLNTIDEIDNSINEFRGSKIVSSIEKTGKNRYKLNSIYQIKYNELSKEWENMDIAIISQSYCQPCSTFDLIPPVTGVLTITELNSKISPKVSVNIDTGLYKQNKGVQAKISQIELKVIDGYTYLPMRRLAEDLGEKVGWDEENSMAYIERGGERIDMTGLLLNGQTFVKIRNFEKLGYKVKWDPISRVASIQK